MKTTKQRPGSVPLIIILALLGTMPVSAQAAESTEAVLVQIAGSLSAFRFDEAIALFDTIALSERESPHIQLLKASVLNSAGMYNEARAIVDNIIRADNGNAEAYYILSVIEAAQGRTRQQQAALEQVIRIDPDYTLARLALGNIHLRNRDLRNAADNFYRVFTNEPYNGDALLGMGKVFRANREFQEAQRYFDEAVYLYPDNAEYLSERAYLFQLRGFLINALDDLDEAKRLDPDNYWIAIDRGNVLLEMNRRSQALDEFDRAISINPKEPQAYIYSSGLKDDLGELDAAERDYEILAELMPEYYFALEGLGLHKMRKENWAEARDAFMEAYRRAPEEHLYGLLAAAAWMRAESLAGPRQYLSQIQARVNRNTLEWYMIRLYYDLTARIYTGESDMIMRLDREPDSPMKARMLFFMAQYYDIRGAAALANRYYIMVSDMDIKTIPEWRLNEWILRERNLKSE